MFFASIKKYLQKEWLNYKRLSIDGRQQLIAYLFAGMAAPMVGTFTNIFLWKETADVSILVWYNAILYFFFPVGFYVSGKLLKRVRPTTLFGIGCVLQGLIPAILIIWQQTSPVAVVVLATLCGISGGIYWSNRNMLMLRATSSKDRLYFLSLQSVLGTITNIAIPILTGWFLVLGQRFGWYSLDHAYRLMAVIAFLLLVLAGSWMRRSTVPCKPVDFLWLDGVSPKWQQLRKLDIVSGLEDGLAAVLPLILILVFVGQEASAGTIQTGSALLATIAMYVVGSRATRSHELPILKAWVLSTIFAGAILALFFRPAGVLIYFAIVAFTASFRWTTLASILFATVEQEEKIHKNHHYMYLFDREIFLNIGRVTALIAFYFFYRYASINALRYMLLFGAITQVGLYFQAKRLIATKTVAITRAR